MRILHLNPTFYPSTRDGGPSESLLLLAQGEIRAGIDTEILTTNGDGPTNSDVPVGRRVDFQGVAVTYANRFPKTAFAPSVDLLRHLRSVARGFDLVHVHALFNFPSTAGVRVLRALGVPYVLSPRGMCDPWALAHRSWKKKPYWSLLERSNLEAARALHATSDHEAGHLRRLFPEQDVFVVPNPVELPSAPLNVARVPRRVAFLGRLHPVKGLDRLVAAMSLLSTRWPDAELVLAGPDHHGEFERIERLAARMTPRPRIRWVGEVHGEAKARFLAESAALALTSLSESFGRVVVEALAHGTPVVASRETPWSRLERDGAGYWVEGEPAAIASALARTLEWSEAPSSVHEAARRVAAEYDVNRVGAAMVREYARVLETPPSFAQAARSRPGITT